MNITEIAIKKPVFAWMIMASFIIFGYITFTSLGISQNPDVDFPVVSVRVEWEGAAPEVMELDVVDQLESSLLAVAGIKRMTSEAKRGRADIVLEFDIEKNIDIAVQEVQAILGQAQRRLPSDIDPPVVTKSNPEDRPIMWMSVSSSNMTKAELMTYVRDQIRDRFMTTPGVSEIFMGGYVEPMLRVWVSDKKLRQFDMSVTDIMSTITNEHAEYPAGIFDKENKEFNVRVLGEASTPEEVANLAINQRGGRPNFSPIPLKRVADVEDGLDDVRRVSRVMGQTSIGLGVRKQRGTNAVAVAHAIKEKLATIQPSLPEGVEMGVNFDSTIFIEEAIDELNFTLILAGLMTSLVVWFFLGSLGTSFNIILSIPSAILATFMALKAFGFTLNTFTMMGLTLAVGLVVDDNIMILENITRFYKKGYSKVQAALLGTNQISLAALASATAIIAIFLPLGFISGIIGRYFYEFAVTLCAAIAFSYIDAITLTPMRASYLLSKEDADDKRWINRTMDKLAEKYLVSLKWTLDHKFLVLIVGVLIFASTFFIFNSIPREFTPAQDQSRLTLLVKTKPGSSLEYTESKVKEIENILMQQPEVVRYLISIGGFGGNESNSANGFITLKNRVDRPIRKELGRSMSHTEWADYMREQFKRIPGVMVILRDPSLSSFGGGFNASPIGYSLTGPDWNQLIELTAVVQQQMRDSGLMEGVDSNYRGKFPEIQIVPDRDKARQRGVAVSEIGRTIQSMVSGVVAGKFAKGGRRYDIKVKIKGDELKQITDIANIMVRNNRGELIPLSDVTKIVEGEGLQSVTREDRARAIQITANMAKGASQGKALDYIRQNIIPTLPAGYSLIETGTTRTYGESVDSMIVVFVLGILIAYMILASQFNSFLNPIVILSALPFSFTGAFIALKLGGHSVNIYSIIGLILLMGIVKKNSIILVDFTNHIRTEGKNVRDALLEACPIRLKPIIMTTVSTLAGTLPAALALGPGSETRVPLALAVIGGLLFSTFLTLYIVPCLYTLLPGKVDEERANLDLKTA